MSKRLTPKKPSSKKGTKAHEHAKIINALDPGRYTMVKKNGKEVPVYVAKLERTLKHQCTATNHFTGKRCGNPPIKGGTVCWMHGGHLPQVKKAAEERLREARLRLIEELDPTIDRLREIRDQDDHMPSALGAATQILNRTLGKPGEGEKDKSAGRTIIKLGVKISARKRVDDMNPDVAVAAQVENVVDSDDYEPLGPPRRLLGPGDDE